MYNMQELKQLVLYNRSTENAKQYGYPTFNECDYYIVDTPRLNPKSKEWINTISIKLRNDIYATLCIMQLSKDEACIIESLLRAENVKMRIFMIKTFMP